MVPWIINVCVASAWNKSDWYDFPKISEGLQWITRNDTENDSDCDSIMDINPAITFSSLDMK